MGLEVRQFPCLGDNYGYLVRDEATGAAAAIDTPDAAAVLAETERSGWRLELILNTHWHPDHAGGNAEVQARTGARILGPEEVRRIAPLDETVGEGSRVALGATTLEVMATPGHTLGHIVYHDPASRSAFVGDTLFAMGCGRLFEGTPEDMWSSLQRLAALDPETRVYCAHEYTAANARFALSLAPDPEITARAEAVFAARSEGRSTVPTTIGQERRTNPFLRAEAFAPALGEAAGGARAFAAVRRAKDAFRG